MKYTPTSVKKDIVDELHKIARVKIKHRRKYIIKGINETIQIDLVEMPKEYTKINKGFRFILIATCCFSKFVWARKLKSKSSKEVTREMEDILVQLKPRPKNLQSDQGKEFFNNDFNKLMKKYKINHYHVFSTKKAAIVERVIRTLKSLMWKHFSLYGNYKWIDSLQDIVNVYNNSYHRTIGMKPSQVNKSNEKFILRKAYTHVKIADKQHKFKVGDHVRVSKYRGVFEKGYTPNWSNEIFIIRKVKLTNPTTYLLKDEKGEDILGGFYELELQKVKHPGVYLVEKVLRRKGNKIFVKWLGFDNTHNSWIDKKNIE